MGHRRRGQHTWNYKESKEDSFFFSLAKKGRGSMTVKKANVGFEHANDTMLIAPVIFKDLGKIYKIYL